MTTNYPMYTTYTKPPMTDQEIRIAALDRALTFVGRSTVGELRVVEVASTFEHFIKDGS